MSVRVCVCKYKVIEEERSILLEMVVSVIRTNMCLILNGYRDRAVPISRPNSVRFFLWGWIKSKAYITKEDTRNELLSRILDAAARIKTREDQLRRTTRHPRTRVAKCTEVDGGILERLL